MCYGCLIAVGERLYIKGTHGVHTGSTGTPDAGSNSRFTICVVTLFCTLDGSSTHGCDFDMTTLTMSATVLYSSWLFVKQSSVIIY